MARAIYDQLVLGYIYLAFATLVGTIAIFATDRGYRIVASTMVLGSYLSTIFYLMSDRDWLTQDLALALLDGGALLIFTGVAIVSRKYWPLWIAAMQLLAVLSLFVPMMGNTLAAYAIGATQSFWSWGQLTILLFVGWMDIRRTR